jgi:hypothetical protein
MNLVLVGNCLKIARKASMGEFRSRSSVSVGFGHYCASGCLSSANLIQCLHRLSSNIRRYQMRINHSRLDVESEGRSIAYAAIHCDSRFVLGEGYSTKK